MSSTLPDSAGTGADDVIISGETNHDDVILPTPGGEPDLLGTNDNKQVPVNDSNRNPSPLIDVDGPIPPPRKESQFRDAIASLERAKVPKPDDVITEARQARDLNVAERRAVAETRAQWQSTTDLRKTSVDSSTGDGGMGLRGDRDLRDDEKKRVAGTREVWKSEKTTGNRPVSTSVDSTGRDLTEDEKARVSRLRNVWKRIDEGDRSEATMKPTVTGHSHIPSTDSGTGRVITASSNAHHSHPSRQLSEDERRRVAETREHWRRAVPWKQVLESSAPIPDRGLTSEEVARIAMLRIGWKKMSDDERTRHVATMRRDFKGRNIESTTAADGSETGISEQTATVDLDAVSRDGEYDGEYDDGEDDDDGDIGRGIVGSGGVTGLDTREVEMTHRRDTASSMFTVNSLLYDDTSALHSSSATVEVDTRELVGPNNGNRTVAAAKLNHEPTQADDCCCVVQ